MELLTPKEFRHRAQGCERSELPWVSTNEWIYANGVTLAECIVAERRWATLRSIL